MHRRKLYYSLQGYIKLLSFGKPIGKYYLCFCIEKLRIMIDKTNNATHDSLSYKSPKIKEIPLTMQGVLCQSNGNDSMREYDLGDAGFSEE